ncbi:hypothetical protein, partial [Serratia marcescens]|uniref:hypothetical protein n=1 Tax=Serratia marcescens TaxID=615 RepID=UPI002DADEE0B
MNFKKPSDIDPTGKNPNPANNLETTGEKTGSATAAGAEPQKKTIRLVVSRQLAKLKLAMSPRLET